MPDITESVIDVAEAAVTALVSFLYEMLSKLSNLSAILLIISPEISPETERQTHIKNPKNSFLKYNFPIIETAKTGLTLFVNDASTAACRLLMQFPAKRSLVTFAPTGKPHSRPKIMAQDASAGNLKGLAINFNGWLNFLRAALDVITEDNT